MLIAQCHTYQCVPVEKNQWIIGFLEKFAPERNTSISTVEVKVAVCLQANLSQSLDSLADVKIQAGNVIFHYTSCIFVPFGSSPFLIDDWYVLILESGSSIAYTQEVVNTDEVKHCWPTFCCQRLFFAVCMHTPRACSIFSNVKQQFAICHNGNDTDCCSNSNEGTRTMSLLMTISSFFRMITSFTACRHCLLKL